MEYLAPEVLEKKAETNCDIWSLGMMILEIVSGFPLWIAKNIKCINARGKTRLGRSFLRVED